MVLIKEYVNTFKTAILNVSRSEKSEHEKYLEVCHNYALTVSALSSRNNKLSLKDIKPINELFIKYQKEYLED